jgi:hypothetical protein
MGYGPYGLWEVRTKVNTVKQDLPIYFADGQGGAYPMYLDNYGKYVAAEKDWLTVHGW